MRRVKMLKYEVYIGMKLQATFNCWEAAEHYALYMGGALIIDGENNIAYHLNGNQITSEILFLEP
jgi:hypothetical protein